MPARRAAACLAGRTQVEGAWSPPPFCFWTRLKIRMAGKIVSLSLSFSGCFVATGNGTLLVPALPPEKPAAAGGQLCAV